MISPSDSPKLYRYEDPDQSQSSQPMIRKTLGDDNSSSSENLQQEEFQFYQEIASPTRHKMKQSELSNFMSATQNTIYHTSIEGGITEQQDHNYQEERPNETTYITSVHPLEEHPSKD
jgi:hypothetical protein